jgi:hypothetical protein
MLWKGMTYVRSSFHPRMSYTLDGSSEIGF